MKLTYSETARIFRSLYLLLHGGFSLAEGVFLLAEEETGAFRDLLLRMGNCMDEGEGLSAAITQSEAFPAHAAGMIRIGETTGRMEEILESLADFYEERCRITRQIKNALAYPGMILLLMLAVIAVLLIKVLPIFNEVYASLGSRLTGIAAALLELGGMLEGALPVLPVLLILGAAAALTYSLCPPIREKVGAWYRRSFGDRGISRKFNNARFSRALSMALRSGLSLEEAMALSRKLLADIPGAAARCEQCAAALEEGADISAAMGAAGLLSPAQSRMLTIGLRGGNADRVMEDIADKQMEEAGSALENMVSRVEPAMVLTASALVGLILLAVMLPLMDILSAIG